LNRKQTKPMHDRHEARLYTPNILLLEYIQRSDDLRCTASGGCLIQDKASKGSVDSRVPLHRASSVSAQQWNICLYLSRVSCHKGLHLPSLMLGQHTLCDQHTRQRVCWPTSNTFTRNASETLSSPEKRNQTRVPLVLQKT
jgi:hypothetical protein